MAYSAPFFASSAEQVNWLSALMAEPKVWCVIDILLPQRVQREASVERVRQLFKNSDTGSFRLFFGRRDLSPTPQWRPTPVRDELDAVRSRVIQFVPSLVVADVLTEGRIDILRPDAYRRADVSPEPVVHWFREVRRSLEQSLDAQATPFAVRSPDGSVARSPAKALFSPDAIRWSKQGGRLKQLAESSIEFELLERAQ